MSDVVRDGGCDCGEVQYKMHGTPLFVHCCHCHWCQRESGSAFALNAMIEADRVELVKGKPEAVQVPSESGRGQIIWRCPTCRVAVWSNYGGAGPHINFVRVGTLVDSVSMPPDIHIFVASKQPWVSLNDGKPQMEAFYDRREQWPEESRERLRALKAAKG